MFTRIRFLLAALPVAALASEQKPLPPRLAVVISVDQMRGDYLTRFRPHFGEGGFKLLLDGGADYPNCHYQHGVTKTAPGHATILSGVNARVHGIIANEWLDRASFIQGNAVEDANALLVGLPPKADRYPNATFAARAGRSPRNYLGVTVGDRLKARHGPAAKVIGIADKDRSAILPAGSKADGAYWTEEGIFITSTYYHAELPAWVQAFNAENNATHYFGKVWDRLREKAIYDQVQGPDDMAGEQAEDGFSVIFPKTVNGGRPTLSAAFYSAFDCTPWNNDLVAEMALRAIDAEQLGQDEVPDLLTIGFSQTDKVGHAYGPDSHEVMDSYLRLDRTLAAFLEQLDAKVGLSRCVIVLTADHGVCPLPEVTWTQDEALVAGRFSGRELDDLVVRALDSAFGVLPESHYWVVRDNSGYHLNPAALRLKELPAARVGAVLRDALRGSPVVATAYTREQLTGSETLDEWGEMTRLSYHPDRSADVLFVEKPFHLARSVGTSHGTPHAYDTHVPQLWFGAGVKPGVDTERVAVEDIAPTLAGLLGVELPAEARGRRLF